MVRNRISTVSFWLGISFAVGGLVLLGYNPRMGRVISILEFLSLVSLGTFFVLRFEALKLFAGRRSTRMGANSIAMAAIFISILGIVNFLSSRHNQRIDLSETRKFTLAPQTTKILRGLDREIKVTAFTQSNTPSERKITDLLNSYAHQNTLFAYQMIDPDKNPAVATNYGITVYDTLVLESGKQQTQIKDVSEQELSNAIIRVTRDERRKVYFLQDHGERLISDTGKDGYSFAKEALVRQGYEVQELSLLTEGRIPEDAHVLVLAGPQKPFFPEEKTAIAQYLDTGGKLLSLLDPQVDVNLSDFLLEWGIRLGPGLIVDLRSMLLDNTIPVVDTYPPHEITEGLSGLRTMFPLVQSITYDSADPRLEYSPLVRTSPDSWSKSDITGPEIKIDTERDPQGPFTVAGIITRKSTIQALPSGVDGPENSEESEPMLIVFGDSDFATNARFYFLGNGDLFLNNVNFLAKESGLISISPKEQRFSPLFLSRLQGQTLTYVSLMVVPGVVFLTGLVVWRRRRLL